MEITPDLKFQLINQTKEIKAVDVLYKKNKKFSGTVTLVNEEPLELKIHQKDKEEEKEFHDVDFDKAVEITLNYYDGNVKVFMDIID